MTVCSPFTGSTTVRFTPYLCLGAQSTGLWHSGPIGVGHDENTVAGTQGPIHYASTGKGPAKRPRGVSLIGRA